MLLGTPWWVPTATPYRSHLMSSDRSQPSHAAAVSSSPGTCIHQQPGDIPAPHFPVLPYGLITPRALRLLAGWNTSRCGARGPTCAKIRARPSGGGHRGAWRAWVRSNAWWCRCARLRQTGAQLTRDSGSQRWHGDSDRLVTGVGQICRHQREAYDAGASLRQCPCWLALTLVWWFACV